MAKLPHRGTDLQPNTGVHLHQSSSSTPIQKPLSFSNYLRSNGDMKPVVFIQSPNMPAIQLVVEAANLVQDQITAPRIMIDLSNAEMNRLMGGGGDSVQFMRDQIDNYEDEVSADFSKGYRAAIEILMGNRVLEDYLG